MNTALTELSLTDRQLLDSLCSTPDGELPAELLRSLLARGTAVVPGLIRILQSDIEKVRAGVDLEADASFFAFVLLGLIGDPSALPVMIDAISLPASMIDTLLGDLIHELLPLFIVKLSHGNVNLVKDLIANRDLYLYVRWSLAGCYLHFVREGLMTREAAAALLEQHLNDEIQYPSYELNAGLALELARLAVPSSLDTIRRACDSENFDETVVTLAELEKDFSDGDTKFASAINGLHPLDFDVVDELSQWASFQPESPKVLHNHTREEEELQPHDLRSSGDATDRNRPQWLSCEEAAPPRTIVSEKCPGRNDPCPCGSGKKYKKCCGGSR
jgi:hypothetical protein